jgi:hypothetical protein
VKSALGRPTLLLTDFTGLIPPRKPDSFRLADHSPKIAGTAANRRNLNCYIWILPVVSMQLRDDDRSPTVLFPLPSVLDFA